VCAGFLSRGRFCVPMFCEALPVSWPGHEVGGARGKVEGPARGGSSPQGGFQSLVFRGLCTGQGGFVCPAPGGREVQNGVFLPFEQFE